MRRQADKQLRDYLASRDAPCPDCGYNLRGLAQGECPECGLTFDVWRLRLAEQRRRPVRMMPPVIAVFAACGLMTAVVIRGLNTDPFAIAGLLCPSVGGLALITVLTLTAWRAYRTPHAASTVADGAARTLWCLFAMLVVWLVLMLVG